VRATLRVWVEENNTTTSRRTKYYAHPHTELVVRGNEIGNLDSVASLVDRVVDQLRVRAVDGVRCSSPRADDSDPDSVLDSRADACSYQPGSVWVENSPDKGERITLEDAGYMETGPRDFAG
jgi:hypothetical protein